MTAPTDRQAVPTWSWALPACCFVVLLVAFWPRPFALARGDSLRYYSGARHLADEGRYYEDYASRPAQPITMHPPLQSLMWAGLLRLGIAPGRCVLIMHAAFLALLGGAGGALAYRITRSWHGPLIWLILACAWPGGVNWILWVRPLTEAGTAALFVAVAWALCVALESDRPRGWLVLAAALAGLSMVLKVTGAFCFPVVGIVALVLWRRKAKTGLITTIGVGLLMLLPYALWSLRNIRLIGTIETNKPSHELAATFSLMATTSNAIAEWFLPIQLAAPVAQLAHPLMIVLPLIAFTLALCAWCGTTRRAAALVPCSIAAIAFCSLGVAMTTKLTEEPRYWSVMIPCLALGVLAIRPPRTRWRRGLFLLICVCFLMFSCTRFAGTFRSLWYATVSGFYLQQFVLACGLVFGVDQLHRLVRGLWPDPQCKRAHLVAMITCGFAALVYWKLGNAPRPVTAFVPLAVMGVAVSAASVTRRRSVVLCSALLPLAATWYLGQWAREDVILPTCAYYERDGVLVKMTPAEARARTFITQHELPRRFASNFPERFSDLFEPHAQVPLCAFPDETRYRAGLSQRPRDEQRVLEQWVHHLREANSGEPLVIIYLPKYSVRGRFYGPQSLEALAEMKLKWELKQEDLHIATCTLIDKLPSEPSGYEARGPRPPRSHSNH